MQTYSHLIMTAAAYRGLKELVGYLAQRRGYGWGRPLLWFAAGYGLHSLVDIKRENVKRDKPRPRISRFTYYGNQP